MLSEVHEESLRTGSPLSTSGSGPREEDTMQESSLVISISEDVRFTPAAQNERQPTNSGHAAAARFSVYTTREKWVIIALAAVAGLYSPLTANSYFPAIQTIANAFHTTVELINVTVTVYMVMQGITPMLWGTISDRVGRRPMFLTCMILLSISCVGMALVPTNAYWLLVLLRCLQAAGSASTVALGNGTVSDIAEPRERGGFVGLFSLGPLVGPCLGPIIGGLLTDNLGWRSIFWFLSIAAGVYFVILLLVFPETLRIIVGDGSIPPPRLNRPLVPIFTKYDPSSTAARPSRPKKFTNPLLQFTHPSVVCILVFNGTVYAVWYGVTATLSTLFAKSYPYLSESEIGLCFLSVGAGSAIGSYANGKMLDADFRKIKAKLEKKRKADADEKGYVFASGEENLGEVEASFPIEYARLRLVPILLTVYVVTVAGYGWAIQRAVHISCPLILQFIVGWAATSVMNTSQTLLMDLFPTQGSSITAANNLVRCTMGAALVSIIDFILRALQPGWTYILLAGVCAAMWPVSWSVVKFGPRWRARRQAKEDAKSVTA